MKAIDGRCKETTEQTINQDRGLFIDLLGGNLSELFAHEYDYLSPVERAQVFLKAIQTSAHLFSGEHTEIEMHDFNRTLCHDIEETKQLVNSFLAS